jgi:NTE family protein
MSVRRPLAVCFGGGGLFGIAYLLGVAEALVDGGVDLASAPAVGTSAGSWAAGAVKLGVRWDAAVEAIGHDIPRLPNPLGGRLREVAVEIFGERRAPGMRAVMCALPRLSRVLLNGEDHALADLVAASSAVPGLLAPHRIDGTLYVDGGVRSMVSADRADPAQNLLVLAPIAGPMFGPAGLIAERIMRREVRHWEKDNPGGTFWLIRPNHAIAALARLPNNLFDLDRAKRCYELSYAQGTGILRRWTEQNDATSTGRAAP